MTSVVQIPKAKTKFENRYKFHICKMVWCSVHVLYDMGNVDWLTGV